MNKKMVQKNILFSLLLFLSIPSTIYASCQKRIITLLQNDFRFAPEQFSNYVFRRYYFIKRLKKSIELFDKINKNIVNNNHSIDFQKLFEFDSSINFKHHRIKESIEQIKMKQNFKPLFIVWQDFVSYKSLDDQLFIEEFTKEIFVISKNVLLQTKPNKAFYSTVFLFQSLQGLTESLLDEIDIITDNIIHKNIPIQLYQKQKYHDFKPLAHINDIIKHFYYIKRLQPSISVTNLLRQNNYYYKQDLTIQKNNSVSLHSIIFHHYKIVACIKAMNTTACLKPLLFLLREVKQYRQIQDESFIRELLLLILIVYKDILAQATNDNDLTTTKSALTTIVEITHTIDQLPIAELLNTIDMLVEELPAFLEKYEFNTTMTWKKWLRKYWWVPPIIIGWFGLKILLTFQHKPTLFGQGGLYQQKPSPIITTDPALLELMRDNAKNIL